MHLSPAEEIHDLTGKYPERYIHLLKHTCSSRNSTSSGYPRVLHTELAFFAVGEHVPLTLDCCKDGSAKTGLLDTKRPSPFQRPFKPGPKGPPKKTLLRPIQLFVFLMFYNQNSTRPPPSVLTTSTLVDYNQHSYFRALYSFLFANSPLAMQ